jgi:hypothetical protein
MNRLKSYVRRTILASAKEYAYPAKRRTAESTKSAFIDAMRGTDTGWWQDLIYTAGMLEMAHKYRTDIAAALAEYKDATGESYVSRNAEANVDAETILQGLLRSKAFTMEQWRADELGNLPDAALWGLRFSVEWYAGELAREYCPDL